MKHTATVIACRPTLPTPMTLRSPTQHPSSTRQSIEAIRFEYQITVEMAARARATLSDDFEVFITELAFLESYLVHARSLHEFLSSRGSRDTDIQASRYVDGFLEKPLDENAVEHVNRRLQHLTTHRQGDNVGWTPADTLPQIVESMGRFIDELSSRPDLANRLSDVHEGALALVESWSGADHYPTHTSSIMESSTTIFHPLADQADDAPDADPTHF